MAWYNSTRDLVSSAKSFGGQVFGDRDDAGILGQGQFKGQEIPINEGAFKDTARYDNIDDEIARALTVMRSGPVMDTAPQGEFRGYQADLAKALALQANGGGPPSIAQQMLTNQTQANIAGAQSQAASMRGVSPALALRLTQQQAANMNQQAVNQGAMLRSQEIQNAQQALGNLSAGARGQDLDLARAMMQGGLARDQNVLQGLSQRAQVANAANQGAQDLEKLKVQQRVGMSSINQDAYANAGKRRADAISGIAEGIMGTGRFSKMPGGAAGAGGVAGGAGGLAEAAPAAAAGASDKNLKTSIRDAKGDPSVEEFLNALSSSTYAYKDPKHGEGRYLGPMAQDLEKTELGKDMVIDTPEGKFVDYGRGAPAYLGIAGMLNERMSDLEAEMQKFFKSRNKKG